MKVELIFKRETQEGYETRIVPVDISDMTEQEGWVLDSSTTNIHPVVNALMTSTTSNVVKFQSDVVGTAKLVRCNNTVKIVRRRGKLTYNETTPNSVCICDTVKKSFFDDCRRCFGQSGIYEFTPKDRVYYDYWNSFVDKEYERQRNSL